MMDKRARIQAGLSVAWVVLGLWWLIRGLTGSDSIRAVEIIFGVAFLVVAAGNFYVIWRNSRTAPGRPEDARPEASEETEATEEGPVAASTADEKPTPDSPTVEAPAVGSPAAEKAVAQKPDEKLNLDQPRVEQDSH